MQIKKTGSKEQNIKCLVYASSGRGKTYLASTLKGKTLIISAEAGLLSIKGEIDYVDISELVDPVEKIKALRSTLEELKKDLQYDNIFVDSLTEIAQIFVEALKKKYPDKSQSMNLWGEYNDMIRTFVKSYRDLGSKYNIIMVALEKTDKDELGRRFNVPDLSGSVATQLPAFFDEVYTIRILDDGKRVIQTDGKDGYLCKSRGGNLSAFEETNLGKLFAKIKGDK